MSLLWLLAQLLLCALLIARAGFVLSESADRIARSLGLSGGWIGLATLVVLLAGSWLPQLGDGLAQTMGWSRSVVGTLFMALITTLPEMAVTLAALRLRALDMAIGNLLGSSLFNVTIIAIDDLFYTHGPLLAVAAPAHIGTALAAMLMCGLVMIGLILRPQGQVLRLLSWVSVGLLATYLLSAVLAYLNGA